MVGNSSSGLLEVAAFGKGTVNIGARQDGRLRAPAWWIVPPSAGHRAGHRAGADAGFRAAIRSRSNPYGEVGQAPARVAHRELAGLPAPDRNVFTTCHNGGLS